MHVRIVLAVLILLRSVSVGAQAPDASVSGPFHTDVGEYRLEPGIDPLVLASAETEIWAKTHYPVNALGLVPVVIFLHGNHPTCGSGANPRQDTRCEYTDTGMCPEGFVVVPNHEGFDYVAQPLASWGYVGISINANRGITCGDGVEGDLGLNKARGRLILRHLQLLSEWNAKLTELPGGLPEELRGRLDFTHVAIVGHSRGGEGARAAYNFYQDELSGWRDRILSPTRIRALFEIAGVDGQTDTTFDAPGTAWTQLLPMCDGDVIDLQGIKPMDRMVRNAAERPLRVKSTYTVWGANHNFFNTQWQESDSAGCLDHEPLFPQAPGSPEQQQIARAAIMALIRGAVGEGADPEFLQNLNPAYGLPKVVADVTRVDRGYLDSPNRRATLLIEDFSQPTGTNRFGFVNDHSGVYLEHGTVPEHDATQRAAFIAWDTASAERFFQSNIADPGSGRDISRRGTLQFRVSRYPFLPDFETSTDLSIALAHADGTLSSSVRLSDYYDLTGPVGGEFRRHSIMQTVRIPLSDFVDADLTRFRGVRFIFDVVNQGYTPDDGGDIYLGDLALVRREDQLGPGQMTVSQPVAPRAVSGSTAIGTARVVSVRRLRSSAHLGGREAVEVELAGAGVFPVTDALATLSIGDATSRLSRYSGDARRLTFVFSREDFEQVGAPNTTAPRLAIGVRRWSVMPLTDKQREEARGVRRGR